MKSRFLKIQIDKNVNVDAAFDEFVKLWYERGGQEWTDQIREAYKNQ